MQVIALFACLVAYVAAAPSLGPCLFDGRVYSAGDTIIISKCLASMKCLGDNNYGELTSLGGVCPQKREADGQNGCLFDGRVYGKGDTILIQPCLATMICEGYNSYSFPRALGGVCPSKKRQLSGQVGCLFDGRVYQAGEKVIIANCLGEMTCLGRNNYSPIVSYGGVCPDKETRAVDGQTGCLFDGRVYATGDTIYVGHCLAKFTCLGHNRISEPISLG
ncbi:hypothetical protein DPMN_030488 [Dreissena polymorpha]|uniref:Secreted protein n=2 Tax=Dreissena polymorpha TaxID=45954 RepID=A0A9D4RG77_DREPO|nr:hypothetical protein DPMN_030488 [Dreissena polymorpha]